jgi:3'-phosphoadenosine 5'-phosphosulfate sulfotransferase
MNIRINIIVDQLRMILWRAKFYLRIEWVVPIAKLSTLPKNHLTMEAPTTLHWNEGVCFPKKHDIFINKLPRGYFLVDTWRNIQKRRTLQEKNCPAKEVTSFLLVHSDFVLVLFSLEKIFY